LSRWLCRRCLRRSSRRAIAGCQAGFQFLLELSGSRLPHAAIFGHCAHDSAAKANRNVWHDVVQWLGRLTDVLAPQFEHRDATEWACARDDFIKDNAEAVEISATVNL